MWASSTFAITEPHGAPMGSFLPLHLAQRPRLPCLKPGFWG